MGTKSGFILINKLVGPTSHDIIDELRNITGIKKIGHAGTLDPFASGLLVVAIGREATKKISKYVKLDKEYVAKLRMGTTTDTFDRTGKIPRSDLGYPRSDLGIFINANKIKNILNRFIGKQKQTPPMFSAKKVKGKKLYKLARKGIEVEREPFDINIFEISLLKYDWPYLEINVKCSSGTYIRVLAHDIGHALGCGAYLEELKRVAVGEFIIEKTNELKNLNQDNWQKSLFA